MGVGSIKNRITVILVGGVFCLLPNLVTAETAYVIDQIEVGLHTENSIESPVVTLVTTGTELEVLQRGVDFSEVRTTAGETGWINTAYLVDEKPGTETPVAETDTASQAELDAAKTEIENLRQQLAASTNDSEATEQIKAMRLKIGELQAELTQLRIENNDQESNEELYERIALVEQEKINLENIIHELKNPNGESSLIASLYSQLGLKKLLTYLFILLVIGAVIGIFIYDFFNRRRHGGFRI